jgi:hypothetical protein
LEVTSTFETDMSGAAKPSQLIALDRPAVESPHPGAFPDRALHREGAKY